MTSLLDVVFVAYSFTYFVNASIMTKIYFLIKHFLSIGPKWSTCTVLNGKFPLGIECSVPSPFPDTGEYAIHFKQFEMCFNFSS